MPSTPTTIRIFISSPGDVKEERQRARQVIEGLRRRYSRHFLLTPVLWEELPLQADMSFQQGIDLVLSKEHGVDIAVFILWSRLGSAVGPLITKDGGGEYRSGTERELDLMFRARQQSDGARPAILVYKRIDENSFDERLRGKRTAEKEELIAQKKLVESFIEETFLDQERGHNIRASHSYDRPVTFPQRLRAHLTELLDQLAGEVTETVWDIDKQGPPFLGLMTFQREHADVFFGRDEEILEARFALREQAKQGCAFLLLTGASGSGKSSLARAGILPDVVQNEVDEQVVAWRSLVVTPAELTGDPILALVRRLASPEVLPDLRGDGASLEKLARGLREHPQNTFDFGVQPAFDQLSTRLQGHVRLLLVIDQLEEMFAAHVMSVDDRRALLSVIETLARSGAVWVLATARSDFYHQIQGEPSLVRLLENRGPMPVQPPGPEALQQLIEEPARLAGLRFEDRAGVSLASRILRDAAAHAELLPLVEFVLREMFESRTADGLLTTASYDQLGGVEGAVGKKAEEAFQSLSAESQAAITEIMPLLVTVEVYGKQAAVRRHAPFGELTATPARRALTESLIAARFLTTKSEEDNTPIASLAHEALLRHWKRIDDWVTANREHLRLRARVEQNQQHWEQERRNPSLLLTAGLPLEEGRNLLANASTLLSTVTAHYIRASITQHDLEQTRKRQRRRVVMAAMSVLTVLALAGATGSWIQRGIAIKAKEIAEQKTEETKNAAKNEETAKQDAQTKAAIARKAEAKALDEAKRADATAVSETKERERADGKTKEANRLLYMAQMNLAQVAWDQTQVGRVLELLSKSQPQPGVKDQPGFEWHYWNRLCHSELLELKEPSGTVTSVVFSADGKRLATAGQDRIVNVWDATSGKKLITLSGHLSGVNCVAFSSDGKRLASAGRYEVKVWDVASSQETPLWQADRFLRSLGGQKEDTRHRELFTFKGHTGLVNSVAFSPDGKRVASAGDDGVKVWDAKSGHEPFLLKGHTSGVNSVAFSADGTRLASAGDDLTVRIWDATSGQPIRALLGHSAEVTSVAFSADGTRLASASGHSFNPHSPGELRVWDATTGNEIHTWKGHTGGITSVAFSPDGRHMASGSFDQTVKVWDGSGHEKLTLKGHTNPVSSVAFSPDGRRLVSASGSVKVWDATNGQEAFTIQIPNTNVTSVAFSPDGTRLASASEGFPSRGGVAVWDTTSGQATPLSGGGAMSVSYSADGKWLASTQGGRSLPIGDSPTGGIVEVWEAVNGKKTLTLKEHTTGCTSVAFSSDGKRLASASTSFSTVFNKHTPGNVKVWDTTTGQVLFTFKKHTLAVNSVAFSPDGKRVASAGSDGVKVWDAVSGRESFPLKGHTSWVNSVVFSVDGTRLASASNDRTVIVWNIATGDLIHTLSGHTDAVTCVAISADGTRLATASRDRTVKVWDAASGQEMLTLKGHTKEASSVAFSMDGKRLASASHDGTVKIWDARPWTDELRVEREALSLIHFLRDRTKAKSPREQALYFDKADFLRDLGKAKDEWLDTIAADQTISEPVRERAMQFAREWR